MVMRLTLQHIVGDDAFDEFLRNYDAESKMHLIGVANNLDNVLSWQDLSARIVMAGEGSRDINVVKNGKGVPLSTITRTEYPFYRPPSNFRRSPDMPKLIRLIHEGYTILWVQAHQHHPPLYLICAQLSDILNVDVRANVYASWLGESPFGLHWDEHDVLILHLSGQKRWWIYPQNERLPPDHRLHAGLAPADDKCDIIDLHEGDMMFLPCGTWHKTQTVEGPSLHVTIGIKTLRGLDLVDWIGTIISRDRKFWKSVHTHKHDIILEIIQQIKSDISNINIENDIDSLRSYSRSKISCQPFPPIALMDLDPNTVDEHGELK